MLRPQGPSEPDRMGALGGCKANNTPTALCRLQQLSAAHPALVPQGTAITQACILAVGVGGLQALPVAHRACGPMVWRENASIQLHAA